MSSKPSPASIARLPAQNTARHGFTLVDSLELKDSRVLAI
jgi:hypothetical protein